MFSATHLPRCSARLAIYQPLRQGSLSLAIALLAVSLTTASMPASAEESQDRFVGPPSRLQPRLSNETGTPRELPAMLGNPFSALEQLDLPAGFPSRLPQRLFDIQKSLPPVQPVALVSPFAQADPLALPQPTPADEVEAPLQQSFVDEQQPSDEAVAEERIATGERLPCYVAKPMSSLTTNIAFPDGDLPANVAFECAATTGVVGDQRLDFGWAQFDFQWAATCLCHGPLYFEEVNAERYGYTASYLLQPVISAGRFFLTIPALPYKMAVDRPHDCIYTLGHYRPGNCVPWRANHLPLKVGAAIVEVGTIAGLIILIP
jgi:hypothetical protein